MRTHASGRRCWRPHLYGDERDKRGGKGKREEHILRSVGDLDVGKLLSLDGGVPLDLDLEGLKRSRKEKYLNVLRNGL